MAAPLFLRKWLIKIKIVLGSRIGIRQGTARGSGSGGEREWVADSAPERTLAALEQACDGLISDHRHYVLASAPVTRARFVSAVAQIVGDYRAVVSAVLI